MNFFKKFQTGLKKTSSLLSTNILEILSTKKIDQSKLEDIETILLSSDIGLEVTDFLIKKIQSSKFQILKILI